MIAAVVGVGGWGSRVARRLSEFDDVLLSAVFDDDYARACCVAGELHTTALKDFTQYLDVQTPDVVVIATPPGRRLSYVQAVCQQARVRKQRIRIEKPLGASMEEAEKIVALCAAAGVELTVGFTLLHHPLYDAVFELAGHSATDVSALRCGRAPAHTDDAMLDQGIHAASIAAYLGVKRADIKATFHPMGAARSTTIRFDRFTVFVDEIALEARTPLGTLHVGDAHDALGCDLRAWLDGVHRGTPDVALAAQRLVTPVAELVAA